MCPHGHMNALWLYVARFFHGKVALPLSIGMDACRFVFVSRLKRCPVYSDSVTDAVSSCAPYHCMAFGFLCPNCRFLCESASVRETDSTHTLRKDDWRDVMAHKLSFPLSLTHSLAPSLVRFGMSCRFFCKRRISDVDVCVYCE